jgi:hypothetical protein
MSPTLLDLAKLSTTAFCFYMLYLTTRLVIPVIEKRQRTWPENSGSNGSSSLATQVAVLANDVGSLKTTVGPITGMVGDVKVLLAAIEDLRRRVRDLEKQER